MISGYLPIALAILVSSAQSALYPSPSGPATYSNSSSPTSGPTAAVTPVCCFAVQDTVSEEWWEITSLSTSHYVAANVTSILTYYTIYPDSTSTRFENVTSHNISTSTVYTNLIGQNPIELFPNGGHGPNETANRLNGTAIVTGGIPVKSPAAFYVYSTIKIITAQPVSEGGSLVCGTASSNTDFNVVYTGINENAESYFGGDQPTGVVISLETPFIYQPARGSEGAVSTTCGQGGGTEDYGYVPQTVLDFLVQNQEYSSQFSGLASCIPGGPSIISIGCELLETTTETEIFTIGTSLSTASSVVTITRQPPAPSYVSQKPVGGDLTESKVVYVTAPGIARPTPIPPSELKNPSKPPASEVKPPVSKPPKPPVSATAIPQEETDYQIGLIINSIIGGKPPQRPSPTPQLQTQPVANPEESNMPTPGALPLGSPTVIRGTPMLVIPATTIPVANAPAGLQGSIVNVDGTPYLVIPAQTTIAAPPSPTRVGEYGITTLIDGTPFLMIPGPTNVPVSGAPSDLTGASTTLINGTPFLFIPSTTLVPLASPTGSGISGQLTVIIDGTSELIISGPTTMPLNPNFSIEGKTTVIDGKTMVIVTAATTVKGNRTRTSSSSKTSTSTKSLTPTNIVASATPSTDAGVRNMGLSVCGLWLGVLCIALGLG